MTPSYHAVLYPQCDEIFHELLPCCAIPSVLASSGRSPGLPCHLRRSRLQLGSDPGRFVVVRARPKRADQLGAISWPAKLDRTRSCGGGFGDPGRKWAMLQTFHETCPTLKTNNIGIGEKNPARHLTRGFGSRSRLGDNTSPCNMSRVSL